jgi:hypothetical protein
MYGESNMLSSHPCHRYLRSSDDLVTPRNEIRAGFVALVLEKNRRATPTVAEARSLKATASTASSPAELTKTAGIEAALLTAAGVSAKAAGHMDAQDKADAIQALVKNFLEPAGDKFVEELVYRFLLTRGDALGGSMRNAGGILAQRKFTRSFLAVLANAQISYRWLDAGNKVWATQGRDDTDREMRLKGISWSLNAEKKTMLYDVNVPLGEKNVDICVLNQPHQQLTSDCLKDASSYTALGELKGGIDPAGFDEHWKTARSALIRIREAFAKKNASAQTFFIANGIARSMADEIMVDLESGTLSCAANLTKPDQVSMLCRWLIGL